MRSKIEIELDTDIGIARITEEHVMTTDYLLEATLAESLANELGKCLSDYIWRAFGNGNVASKRWLHNCQQHNRR